ncbi:S49 family peptidase [Pseudonocardiaceae bacterium YIM PH 21723]|nr:S49 family peptidase [Pseudonocardiaceae bacterium YIM PH 21723]
MSLADKLTDTLAGRIPGIPERTDRPPLVAVVKLHGVITPVPSPISRGSISLAGVESALTRAFGSERLAAVALVINSPGGAPTQSALISDRIRGLAEKKKVPVLAFCEDVAASGGYWLACAADEIYAHPTSMVGSIGVISSGFGLGGVLEKLGVERRVHTAGDRKARLDPFKPEKPADVKWLKELQGELHTQFADWVKERRGDKLTGPEKELFSGEVWTGAKAAELGLIDGTGTMRSILTKRFGEFEVTVAEPKRPLLARLGMGGGISALGTSSTLMGLLDAMENRASWSRYGL